MTAFKITLGRGAKRHIEIVRSHKMADAVVAAARRNPGLLVIDTMPFGSGSSGSRFKVPIKIRNPGITETRAALESLTSSKVLLDAIG